MVRMKSVLANAFLGVGCFGFVYFFWFVFWPFAVLLGVALVPLGFNYLYKAVTLQVEEEFLRKDGRLE